jgi:hypothetical protein
LWQQGPKKSDHHGDHGHSEHEDHAGEEGEEKQDGGDEQEQHDEVEGKGEPGEKSDEESGKEGGDEEAADKKDKEPLGEATRNEPPNEISSSENKWTSGDEGLKEGDDDSAHKKSQQRKTIDPDADEGKKDMPSDKIDKGQEGEQKGTRITEGDKERKVSSDAFLYCACDRNVLSWSICLCLPGLYQCIIVLQLQARGHIQNILEESCPLSCTAPSIHCSLPLRHGLYLLLPFTFMLYIFF